MKNKIILYGIYYCPSGYSKEYESLIYIGKTKNLDRRKKEHFRMSNKSIPKTIFLKSFRNEIKFIVINTKLTEGELIMKYNPMFNKAYNCNNRNDHYKKYNHIKLNYLELKKKYISLTGLKWNIVNKLSIRTIRQYLQEH